MVVQKKIKYLKDINSEDVNLKNSIENNFSIKIPEKDLIKGV